MYWPSFAYGSIIPDFDKKHVNRPHTLEGSINTISAYGERLARHNISIEDFSMGLGVICHYVCDYFCMHHGKNYWKKAPLSHGIYEVNLEIKFLKLFVGGSININYHCKKEKNIKDIIMKLHKKYSMKPKGMLTDITYAIIAAIAVCQAIINDTFYFNSERILVVN